MGRKRYENNGDGTFTSKDFGGPSSALGWPIFGDYNNDGFLDVLMMFCPNARNTLYWHNGNINHWLKVKLDGRASNRSGIGSKGGLNATIGGTNFWQMREVSCENGYAGQNGLLAHFGLGDATDVTMLRIEWPSGIVEELPDVAANQSLTVEESQSYGGQRPALTGVEKTVSGLHLTITEPDATARYLIEASTDLTSWTKLMARTSAGGTTNYLDRRLQEWHRRLNQAHFDTAALRACRSWRVVHPRGSNIVTRSLLCGNERVIEYGTPIGSRSGDEHDYREATVS